MFRGYSYRLYPTAAQAETLGHWIGATRAVYNLALEQRRDHWRRFKAIQGKHISWFTQCAELKNLRASAAWIAAVPSSCLILAMRDLQWAFDAFHRGSGYPTFRKRGDGAGVRMNGRDVCVKSLNRKWGAVRLPKLGWVKFRDTRPVGHIVNVTITEANGQWRVSFSCEIETPEQSVSRGQVGIDRGIANTITLSTGETFQAPTRNTKGEKRLQRSLSRRKRGSNRRAQQARRVAALRAKAARARKDWAHRTSTTIARCYGWVAIEDLKVVQMTAAGRGKRGLNRAILEQGWGMFARFLKYKVEERGGHFIKVPAAYTSQTCSACGVVDAKSRKSQAVFECVACGHTGHADTNAAIEILRRSTAWLDGEAGVSLPTNRQLATAA